jgi:hypothetical protein
MTYTSGQTDSPFNRWGTVKVLEVQVEHFVIPLKHAKGLHFFQNEVDFEIFAQKIESGVIVEPRRGVEPEEADKENA